MTSIDVVDSTEPEPPVSEIDAAISTNSLASQCETMVRAPRDDRAVSKVVGVVLLVAIAVVLAAVATAMAFGLTQEREPAPEVVLDLAYDGDGAVHQFAHDQGERLDGEKLTLRGTADPDGLAGSELAAGQRTPVYPTDDAVTVVWTGEHGTTYTLDTFETEATVPEPDEGCPWVDVETNGGTDDITIDATVVDCDVRTDRVIEVRNGGVVIGATTSDANVLDGDDATFYGDVSVEDTANLQDSAVHGAVTSRTADVKVDASSVDGPVSAATEVEVFADSTVGGSLTADDEIEVLDGSSIDGDVQSDDDLVKVLDSDVAGSLITEGDVKLDGATVEGEVYVDGTFDCTDATIGGQNCGGYTPRDTDDR